MLSVPIIPMAAAPQELFPGRCLWARHRGAACTHCVDACPAGALVLADKEIVFDVEQCVGCGVCLVTCPVEAFETTAWSERNLVRAVEPLPHGASVEIVCRQHPAPQLTAEGASTVQVNACLGALSPGLWFELALSHRITVRLEACAECPYAGASRVVEQAVALAAEWQVSCERPVTLSVRKDAVASAQRRPQPVYRAEEIRRSRRELLFSFARSAGPPAQALACLPTAFQTEEDARRAPPHQPAWLRRLAALYARVAARGASQGAPPAREPSPCFAANWPALQVSAACTACGSCARYCPSGALSTGRSGDVFEHRFVPGVCISCGLCALVCQPDAITRGYQTEETPFVERVVATRGVEACCKCGGHSVATADGLCYWCANEPPIRSVLENAQRLFARR